MILIPFVVGNGEYNMFIILEDENLRRMADNDPAQVNLWKMPAEFAGLKLRTVILASSNIMDRTKAIGMIQNGQPIEALKYLSRGFKFKPDEGDNDLPYLSQTKPS